MTAQRYVPGGGTTTHLEQAAQKPPNCVTAGYKRLYPKLILLAQEFCTTDKKRGLIKTLATRHQVPYLAARRYLAKYHPVEGFIVLEGEEWKPVAGYEGLYQVSTLGRVKRTRILKHRLTQDGYAVVALSKRSQVQGNQRVHRLVAMAFLPNPDGLPQVNHIDGNKLNNHISNLEWVSARDNLIHAWQTGLNPRKSKHSPSSPQSHESQR